MAGFNGTGTFERTYNWATDSTNGISIEASRMDTEDDGFATGLSNCITKDGQTTITANIPFNSKKITGLANGSARTDSINLGQVQDNTYRYLGENGGTADAYTWNPSPAITSYKAGQEWIILIGSGDSNTGASTANISSLGNRDIKKFDSTGSTISLENGDLTAGGIYKLIDNGTELILQNPKPISKPISLFVYLSANQAVTTSVITKMQLNAVDINDGGYFDATTNYRWTPPEGRYLVNFGVSGVDAGSSSQGATALLYKNGSSIQYASLPYFDNGNGTPNSSIILDLNGTDYLELFGSFGGVGSLSAEGSRATFLSAIQIK